MNLTNLFNHEDKNRIDTNMYRNVKALIFNYPCKKFHPDFNPHSINKFVLNIPIRPNNWLSNLTSVCDLSLGHQVTMTSNDDRGLFDNTFNLHFKTA